MSSEGDALGTGPCVGCGEMNHTAHRVSICAACLNAARKHYVSQTCSAPYCCRRSAYCEKCSDERAVQACSVEDCVQRASVCRAHVEERLAAEREQRRILGDPGGAVRVSFSPFEAAMVLCVLAVAKAGDSRYDTAAEPLRRRAIEAAYVRLSCEMALPKELSEAEPSA